MDVRKASFSMLEVAVSLGIVAVLLAMLIPALISARALSYQKRCTSSLRQFGGIWATYLEDHDGQFPFVPVRPGWHYGGARFSSVTGEAFVDYRRPLNAYLPARAGKAAVDLFACPADCGISHEHAASGTAGRTAYLAHGTSYRANASILDARIADFDDEPRGLRRDEITTFPSRFVLMGDPVWYEVYESTGRNADWHDRGVGNLLFLDGSVRYQPIRPRGQRGPAVIEPVLRPLIEAETKRVEQRREAASDVPARSSPDEVSERERPDD